MPFNAALASRNLREQIFAGSPTVFYEENFPLDLANADNAIGATTLMTMMAVALYEGDTVTKASICVGATAGATLTHKFFGLYSGATIPLLLAQSADDTGAAMAANTVYTQSLTAPFVIPTTGLYWAGICITGTTIPTVIGKTTGVNATAIAALNTLLGGTRTNGLCVTSTGAASIAPATMASLTQLAVQPWICLQ
jgi:hypothetical protein